MIGYPQHREGRRAVVLTSNKICYNKFGQKTKEFAANAESKAASGKSSLLNLCLAVYWKLDCRGYHDGGIQCRGAGTQVAGSLAAE